ncbi:hypothetical protein GALMADRAFT_143316 [Galerina marginata CBS 339.88]|uniref:Uncharacterized protein n=1 Tax=Galerina marginata (strain CBS 339.88) TaxID=685588 RepID=A0A067SM64_GALM3|nr:hypothetical protein GALMADRAFT_143316 [Galerina marginata CBS 339.88]
MPDIYWRVLGLLIARRPLFPVFYKAVIAHEPGGVSTIEEIVKRGQPFFVALGRRFFRRIDEVYAIGRKMDRDPARAQLEMLDPKQNNSFDDHYVDVLVDLSCLVFVSITNILDTIPAPLLDCMEVLEGRLRVQGEGRHRIQVPRPAGERGERAGFCGCSGDAGGGRRADKVLFEEEQNQEVAEAYREDQEEGGIEFVQDLGERKPPISNFRCHVTPERLHFSIFFFSFQRIPRARVASSRLSTIMASPPRLFRHTASGNQTAPGLTPLTLFSTLSVMYVFCAISDLIDIEILAHIREYVSEYTTGSYRFLYRFSIRKTYPPRRSRVLYFDGVVSDIIITYTRSHLSG